MFLCCNLIISTTESDNTDFTCKDMKGSMEQFRFSFWNLAGLQHTSQSQPEVGMTPAELLLLRDKGRIFVCSCVWHSGNPFAQSDSPLSLQKSRESQLFQIQLVLEPLYHKTQVRATYCFS